MLDAEALVKQKADEMVPELRGRIQFDKMDFQYVEGETVLRDFDLEIHPGETLALVGHTGSGKSSIAKLITRFYEYQAGDLLIDGRDIRYFNLSSYRSQLGVVTQTPFLFDGTVMDNIRYGKPEASDEEVIRIANKVGPRRLAREPARGLEYHKLANAAGNLSMGQRQLVAIARVLLQDPAIFILDEATASVDPLTETLIQEGAGYLVGQPHLDRDCASPCRRSNMPTASLCWITARSSNPARTIRSCWTAGTTRRSTILTSGIKAWNTSSAWRG